MPTKYGPKGLLSPTLGDPCPICRSPLLAGDYTTLVRSEDTSRHGDKAVEAHWECVVRDEPPRD